MSRVYPITIARILVGVAFCLSLSNCVAPPPQTDHNAPASLQWSQRSAILSSADGRCNFHYTHYRPAHPRAEVLIVLGHGFLRSQARMVDLARALATAGLETLTLDFCNDRLWDGGHLLNGLDMVRLADHFQARQVIYAGFSAGALAALIAARNDPNAIGVIALDLVDAQRLGVTTASALRIPLIALVGEPSSCNAQFNAEPIYRRIQRVRVERIDGATHCAFESPTDWLCRTLCGESADGVRQRIIEQVVEAALRLSADSDLP